MSFLTPLFCGSRILIIILFLQSQKTMAQVGLGDCTGAIELCGNGRISSNAIGTGNLMEINANNSCSSFEHNSLWIRIEITRSGTLGFTLRPTDPSIMIDYDFFIFGPNATCGNLGNTIRCSTTNPNAASQGNNLTGMNDTETDTSEGPGPNGNSFVRSLDVLPGESYYIVIDRPIGESPFELEWTGTATVDGSPFPDGVEVNEPDDLVECGVNGVAEFDLFETRDQITGEPQAIVEYYPSLGDATDRTNRLGQFYTSGKGSKTVFVRIENPLTGCYDIVDFDLIVPPGPPALETLTFERCDLDKNGVEDFDLNSQNSLILNGLAPGSHSLSFYRSKQEAQEGRAALNPVQTSAGGTVYARIEEKEGDKCFAISEVNLMVIEPVELTGPDLENISFLIGSKTFTVSLKKENYDFSLNDPSGPYQDDTKFNNVPPGINVLYIRAKDRCAITSVELVVPAFDLFITPNNDGRNDTWRVDLGNYSGAVDPIRIFDRYGNFLDEIRPNSSGWNGIYNGKQLPSDDYWFILRLPEHIEIKGHFSLIR